MIGEGRARDNLTCALNKLQSVTDQSSLTHGGPQKSIVFRFHSSESPIHPMQHLERKSKREGEKVGERRERQEQNGKG